MEREQWPGRRGQQEKSHTNVQSSHFSVRTIVNGRLKLFGGDRCAPLERPRSKDTAAHLLGPFTPQLRPQNHPLGREEIHREEGRRVVREGAGEAGEAGARGAEGSSAVPPIRDPSEMC